MCVCATVCGCVKKEPARSNDLKRGQLLAAQLRWFTNSIAAGESGRYRDEVERFRDSGRKVWRRREKSNNGGKKTSFRRNLRFKKAHVQYVYYGIVVWSVSAVYTCTTEWSHFAVLCEHDVYVCLLSKSFQRRCIVTLSAQEPTPDCEHAKMKTASTFSLRSASSDRKHLSRPRSGRQLWIQFRFKTFF